MKLERQNQLISPVAVDWRSQAQAVLPELVGEIAASDNSMALWIEIGLAFNDAYDEPRNADLVRRIYGFASWCVEQPTWEHAPDDLFQDDLSRALSFAFMNTFRQTRMHERICRAGLQWKTCGKTNKFLAISFHQRNMKVSWQCTSRAGANES